MSSYVDTNVFIRVLTGDDPEKAARCLALFQRVQRGEEILVTSEAVVAEITYVLTSRTTYNIPRAAIATALRPILALPGLHIVGKEAVLGAIDLWERVTIDFADCLAIEHARRLDLDGIYSFDRGHDRVPGIRRLEP